MRTLSVERKLAQPIWPSFVVLLLLTLVSQLSILTYNNFRTPDAAPLQSALLSGALVISLLTGSTAGFGLILGRQFGLGAPLISALLFRQKSAYEWLRRDAALAVPLGAVFGVVLILLRLGIQDFLPSTLPAFGERGIVFGVLGTISAAIGEEVWFRLGIMTALIWALSKLMGHAQVRVGVAWGANILSATAFAALHLPNLVGFDALNSLAIAATMIGNISVGLLYGWLYWRRSLVAAMLCHLSVDVVLHVIPAMVS
jgi:membrane protease YdiL (CAAX protease family)